MSQQVVVGAAVQAEPVWLDAAGGVDKTIALIEEASRGGAELVVFPEVFIAGYPWQVWHGGLGYTSSFVQRYHAASIERDGAELRAVAAAACRAGTVVVLGFSEYDRGSLYISQAFISETGEIVGVRRKLKPTSVERSVYGDGSGADLQVHQMSIGRVGGLSCWEHIQPLSKYTLFSMGEQFHAASWPNQSSYSNLAASCSPDGTDALNQTYAIEGQVFVLEATSVILDAGLELFHHDDDSRTNLRRGGGSTSIWAPNGDRLAKASGLDVEEIVYAPMDFAAIEYARASADPVGHYSRPDVFTLHVDFSAPEHVRPVGADAPSRVRALNGIQPTPPSLEEPAAEAIV